MVIQPEFKYYQNYEFHKLNQSLNIDKNFSFMHTNICSISGNIGKLETLLSNLEHNFDVLALSETWTKTNYKSNYVIDGYQTFHGIGGQSLKSGCGFFVKEGLKYKQRTDLEMSFKDENNQFQFFWIEDINSQTPNIIIGCYHRHPKKTSNGMFIEKLKRHTKQSKKSY